MSEEMSKPDFLCIGAQKSATTWLQWVLSSHPDVFLSPVKELDYFTHPNQSVPQQARRYRFEKFDNIYMNMRNAQKVDPKILLYLANTCLVDYQDDDYYRSIFEPYKSKICGDISPSYSRLSQGEVEYVNKRLPQAKIIFLMRDPIERCWSNLDQNMRFGFMPNNPTIDQMKVQINAGQVADHSNYARTLKNWSAHYDTNLIHVEFMENVIGEPLDVLQRVCDFLGLSYRENYFKDKAGQKANELPNKKPMPPEIEKYIAEKNIPMLEELQEHLGKDNPISTWLDRCKSIAQQ